MSGPPKLEQGIEAPSPAFRNRADFEDPGRARHEQSVDEPGPVRSNKMRGFPEAMHLLWNRKVFGHDQLISGTPVLTP